MSTEKSVVVAEAVELAMGESMGVVVGVEIGMAKSMVLVSPLPAEMESLAYGEVVPSPTLPLPCWRTNCDEPMVKPWPVAIVVVPDVFVNAPRPK